MKQMHAPSGGRDAAGMGGRAMDVLMAASPEGFTSYPSTRLISRGVNSWKQGITSR